MCLPETAVAQKGKSEGSAKKERMKAESLIQGPVERLFAFDLMEISEERSEVDSLVLKVEKLTEEVVVGTPGSDLNPAASAQSLVMKAFT